MLCYDIMANDNNIQRGGKWKQVTNKNFSSLLTSPFAKTNQEVSILRNSNVWRMLCQLYYRDYILPLSRHTCSLCHCKLHASVLHGGALVHLYLADRSCSFLLLHSSSMDVSDYPVKMEKCNLELTKDHIIATLTFNLQAHFSISLLLCTISHRQSKPHP